MAGRTKHTARPKYPPEQLQPSPPPSFLQPKQSPFIWLVAVAAGFLLVLFVLPQLTGQGSALRTPHQVKFELPPLNHSKLAILIEKEAVPTLIPVLLNFLSIVPASWPFLVMTGAESDLALRSARVLQPHLASGKLALRALPDEDSIYSGRSKSKFLAGSSAFWDSLPAEAESLLMFEADAVLCANSELEVDDFLGFDSFPGGFAWVGAPWFSRGYPATPFGGNGGLSLRRRSIMADLTGRFEHDGSAEDVWFSDRIQQTTNFLPSTDIAMRFALETPPKDARHLDWALKPAGAHVGGVWMLCHEGDQETIKKFLGYCPEAAIVITNNCLVD